MGLQRVWHNWATNTFSWRREWLPTPVSLPEEFHGQRSLAGCYSGGHKQSDMTEWLTHTPIWGFPWWLRRWRIRLRCRRPRFDPWVGNMPWRWAWQPMLQNSSCLSRVVCLHGGEKEWAAQGGEGTPGLLRERAEPCGPPQGAGKPGQGSACARGEVSGWWGGLMHQGRALHAPHRNPKGKFQFKNSSLVLCVGWLEGLSVQLGV